MITVDIHFFLQVQNVEGEMKEIKRKLKKIYIL